MIAWVFKMSRDTDTIISSDIFDVYTKFCSKCFKFKLGSDQFFLSDVNELQVLVNRKGVVTYSAVGQALEIVINLPGQPIFILSELVPSLGAVTEHAI